MEALPNLKSLLLLPLLDIESTSFAVLSAPLYPTILEAHPVL
jgi:hypothetical protein